MKIIKCFVSLGMVLISIMGSMTVKAANVVQIPASEVKGVYNQSVQSNQIEGWAKGPHIYSEAGIVMDIDSGTILYAKNIDAQHYPASITKIMTALVALEQNELTDIVTVKREDVSFLESGDAHIGLRPGEEITLEHAMHGMLLASGNEVSHAIGSSTEGGYDNFLRLMNEKAAELGCTNSHFTNTYGLQDPEHYVSARDMALISAAAFQNEEFRRITSTLQYTIPETNLVNEKRTFQQHHKMLFDWRKEYYEYCVGGKTGYTKHALNTLVTYATKGDMNLVSVVLRTHGGATNMYADTEKMLDYGFNNFYKIPVTVEMTATEGLSGVDNNSYVIVPTGITFEQLEATVENPTELGDKTGSVTYTYNGQAVGTVHTILTDEYYNEIHGIKEVEKKQEEKKEEVSVWGIIFQIFIIIVIVVAVLFLMLMVYITYKRRQLRMRRKRRRDKRM